IGARVIPMGALGARESGLRTRSQSAEELLRGSIEACEYILQDVAVNSGVFRECRTKVLQFRLLLEPCRRPALPPPPPRHALLQGTIGERAAPPHDTRKFPLLIGSELQLAFQCLAHSGCVHRRLCCLIADKTAIKPDFKRDWWLKPRNASPPG